MIWSQSGRQYLHVRSSRPFPCLGPPLYPPRPAQAALRTSDAGLDRLGGRSKVKIGDSLDRPHLDFLPDVVRNYGVAVEVGAGGAHVYQALPRLLTLWYEFGAYVCTLSTAGITRQVRALAARPRPGANAPRPASAAWLCRQPCHRLSPRIPCATGRPEMALCAARHSS